MNRVLILCAYLSLFALGFADNVRGPLFPEILGAFGLSNSVGSLMWVLSSLGGAAGGWSCRWILRRFTRVKALNFSTALMGIGLFVIASAPTFPVVILGSILTGWAMGLTGVLQNAFVSMSTRDETRSRVLGGLHAMYGISSFLAPLGVAVIAMLGGGWRWALVGAGTCVILTAVGSHLRFHGAEHGSFSHVHKIPSRAPVSTKTSVWWALALGSYVAAEVLVESRLALFARLETGASLESSSLMVTVFFVCLLASRLLTAAWPVRGNPLGPLLFCLFASAGLVLAGLTWGPWALAVSGFAMGPIYPLSVAFLGREFGEGIDSVMGWALTVQGVMVASMHLGVGVLTDAVGIRSAMFVGPLALCFCFLLMGCYGTIFRHDAARI